MNLRKTAIIGCGNVGATTAYTLMQSGLFSEMVLIDVDTKRARGEAEDIAHGLPFHSPMTIYQGDYGDIAVQNGNYEFTFGEIRKKLNDQILDYMDSTESDIF